MTGLTLVPVDGFDREQWTTCHIARLAIGDIFGWPQTDPIRPAILLATRIEDTPGDMWGLAIGAACYVDDTGERVEFELRANTSVLTCCDRYYDVPDNPQGPRHA